MDANENTYTIGQRLETIQHAAEQIAPWFSKQYNQNPCRYKKHKSRSGSGELVSKFNLGLFKLRLYLLRRKNYFAETFYPISTEVG